MLKPRLARTCLKFFLDPNKPLGVNYGGIIGLQVVGGVEVIRAIVLPSLKEYEILIRDAMEDEGLLRKEAEMVLGALVGALQLLEQDSVGLTNGFADGDGEEGVRSRLKEKVGHLVAAKVLELGRPRLVKAILQS